MSDTRTRDSTNGVARSNKSFPQFFFVQDGVFTVHSISNTSNKERDEGSKNKGINQKSISVV